MLAMSSAAAQDQPWACHGGEPGGGRHSPLRQITAANVDKLAVAWTFRTGEVGPGDKPNKRLTFEATPIVVGDTMFVSTAYGRVFALGRRHWHAALAASTGALVWRRQLVHHDLWDYDLPAQPALVDLQRNGQTVPAVVQTTKMGMVYVFHCETGQPLFDIVERPVPASDVPGETASPTQPFSTLPALARQSPVKPEDAWGLTPWDKGKCRDQIAQYRSEGIYTPPSLRGSIQSPAMAAAATGVAWPSTRSARH